MTTALWIGRFQPYTLGHDCARRQIEKKNTEKLIIGIGSAQEEFTQKNPFTYYEREEMVGNHLEKTLTIPFEIFPIPDFGDNEKWTNYILKNAPNFDTVYSGNPHTQICFKDTGKEFKPLRIQTPIKATNVREQIAKGESVQIPEEIEKYLKSINAKERLEKLIQTHPRNPPLAVDGIMEYGNGIVLIERKNPPYGWALPGGFVDYGESCEVAVVREMKEETNLDFVGKQFRMYSDPDRDPRQHIASMVFVGQGHGTLQAKDDAMNARVVNPKYIGNYDLVFDHKKIIDDYLKTCK